MRIEHLIRGLCQAFGVSPSGFYDWQKRQAQPGPRRQEDQRLKEQICQIHKESRQTYGAPRIQAVLRACGQRHGSNRLQRLMREQQICGRQRKRFRIRTTDSRHDQPIAPNRLACLPRTTRPNQIWVADITYISTVEGWLYLAAVMDLHSRRIVGWALSERINTALVMAAWNMALCHRQPPAGLIFHSDRGVQYASLEYRSALKVAEAIASMSRKGNCYDNAAMEAFWSTLKREALEQSAHWSKDRVRRETFEYIEAIYNRTRLHSSLGYRSPVEFENQNN